MAYGQKGKAMIQTKRLDRNRLDHPRLPWLPILLVAILAIVLGLAGIDYFNRPAPEPAPYTLMAYELPAVPFNMSVTALGDIQVTVPTDVGMPTPPNCKEYNLPEDCRWDMKWTKRLTDDRFDQIEVKLMSGDDWIMSRVQLMEVKISELPQLASYDMAGHQTGWIAHVQVAQRFMGNGIGKLTWQAGDAALKIWAGANGADSVVRIIADMAGWGTALMSRVPQEAFLFADDPLWAYLIQKG